MSVHGEHNHPETPAGVIADLSHDFLHAIVETIHGPVVVLKLLETAVDSSFAAGVHLGIVIGAIYPDRCLALREHIDGEAEVTEGVTNGINEDARRVVESLP